MKWNHALITAACLLFLLVALASTHAFAQVLYGTLVGTVTDPDGKALGGASVTAVDAATGNRLQQVTDNSGNYALHNLAPSTYFLEISANGFAVLKITGITVRANLIVRADEALSVNVVNQSIEVNASSAQLQTDSGVIHGDFSTKELSNLPIGGYSNYQSLINLTPGATPSRYQNAVMDTPSRSLTTNINGASRTSNVTAVDGAAIQQVYLPHHTLYNPPTEDIQSVDIVTNSFTAEQGLAGGAAISVLTKSGTNNLHGTFWEQHTNSAMSARNYFYNKTYYSYARDAAPKNILNQFGANLGGPILHNRLFFFSGFEGMSQRQLYAYITTLPTDSMRSGDFTGLTSIYDPTTGNTDGTGRVSFASENTDGKNAIESGISPAALKMLALIPHANLSGTSNNYSVTGIDSLDRFSFDEKISWQIDPKSSLFGKLSYLDAQVKAPSSLGTGGGSGLISGGGSGYSQSHVIIGGLGYTHIFSPTLLLDANFGIGHNYASILESDYNTDLGTSLGIPGVGSDSDDGSYGKDPYLKGLPSFAVTGLETFGHADNWNPEIKHDFTFTYVGNMTWSHSRHTVRFGLQALNNRLNQYQPQRSFGPVGGFTFTGGVTALKGGASSNYANAFAQFLLGLPDSLGRSYQYENPMIGHEWQWGAYGQDQWQATRKLTLTYGLRWEYYPIMTRTNGLGLGRYDMTTNKVILGDNSGTTASKLQFAPRFGAAYRWSDKTVFRGGYGISIDPYPFSRAMRDPYPITIAQTVNANNSYQSAGNFVTGIPSYDTVAPVISNGMAALPLTAYTKTLAPGTFRRGYIESWNATVEQLLPGNFNFALSYVGTQGIRQIAYLEANAGQTPGLGSAGQPLYQTFSRNAQTQVITPWGTTHYNALQTSLKHPFSHGVLLTVAYTWSKSMDENTDDDSTPLFNAVAYQYRNRAVSDFDRRHVFDAGLTAELPFGRNHLWFDQPGFASQVLSGWKINAMISAYTGLPFTPTASTTSLNAPNNTQVADKIKDHVSTYGGIGKNSTWFDTSAFAAVTEARFGTASRNSLRGPGAADLDLGVSRSFDFTEKLKLELRGDAFNLTNTPAFSNPATSASSSSFGHITATAGGVADSRVLRVSGRFSF
jgi:outer membrane receptor protein involved in Fe transport